MKFRFLVVFEDYEIQGLNNIEKAKELAKDFCVVDCYTGQLLHMPDLDVVTEVTI